MPPKKEKAKNRKKKAKKGIVLEADDEASFASSSVDTVELGDLTPVSSISVAEAPADSQRSLSPEEPRTEIKDLSEATREEVSKDEEKETSFVMSDKEAEVKGIEVEDTLAEINGGQLEEQVKHTEESKMVKIFVLLPLN